MRFVVDPHDPVLALDDCKYHMAMMSDLLAARGPSRIDFTEDGLTGLCVGITAVGRALEELSEILGAHVHAAWGLGRRMHQLGLLPDSRATSADLAAVVNRLLDTHETETKRRAAEAGQHALDARIEELAAQVRAAVPAKAREAKAPRAKAPPRLTEPRAAPAPRRRAA